MRTTLLVFFSMIMALLAGMLACAASTSQDYESESDGIGTETGTQTGVSMDGTLASACFIDGDCQGDDLVCYGAGLGTETTTAGFCTDNCAEDTDCNPIDDIATTCSPQGQCRIDCAGQGQGDGPCPADMECRALELTADAPIYRCLYPEGTGAGDQQEWEACDTERGDADCAYGRSCYSTGASGTGSTGYCATACEEDIECTQPAGVTAQVLCAPQTSVCSLDCAAEGSTCPTGMQCIEVLAGDPPLMRCRFVTEVTQEGQ